MPLEAELKRRAAGGGGLLSWELVLDPSNVDTGRSDPVIDYGVRELLLFESVIDANNTTVATLGAGATFTGVATEISPYKQMAINIFGRPGIVAGDASSAKASFYFEFSKDGSAWDISVPHLIRDPSLVIPIPVIHVHKYFRVKYINDGGSSAIAALGLDEAAGTPTAQTVFRLTTYLYPVATKELTRTLDQSVSGSDPVTLTRGVKMGRTPGNAYVNERANGFDARNSSTTILGSSATFQGTIVDVSGFVSGFIIVNADQASQADGIIVEFSDTLAFTNVRSAEQTFTYTSADLNKGRVFPFLVSERFMRVRYINGTVAQGAFYLATFLHIAPIDSPREALNSGVENGDLATMVRGPTLTRNGSGVWGIVERGPNGGEKVHLDAMRSIKVTRTTVTNVAAQVTTAVTGRKSISIKNIDSQTSAEIYVYHNSSASTGNGYLLRQNHEITLEVDETAVIYVISDSGSGRTMSILEVME